MYVGQGGVIRFVRSSLSFLGSLFFFLVDCFGWMESVNVTVVLQEAGDADSGPAPDPRCKLIISSFLALSHLLDCLICTRNTMSIVLLLQMIGGCGSWGEAGGFGGLIYIRVSVEGQGVGII